MLEKKDYQTKDVKPETKKTELPVSEKNTVIFSEPPAKPKPESLALAKRVKALEVAFGSAFAMKDDGTVRKLKRRVRH